MFCRLNIYDLIVIQMIIVFSKSKDKKHIVSIKRLIHMYGKSSKYITGFQNTTAHVFVLWVMLIRVF